MKLQRVAQHLYRRQPGGQYYAVCSVKNRKCCKSLKTLNRRKAESRLADALAELRANIEDGGTWAQIAQHWIRNVLDGRNLKPSARRYRLETLARLLKDFPALSTKPIGAVTLADCQSWKAARAQVGSACRVNNELGTLRMVFSYAVDHGLCATNPAAKLSRERVELKEQPTPTRAQFEAIIGRFRARKRTATAANFVELIAYTGMRQNEAAQLRWDEIDLDRGMFWVRGGPKGTKNRRLRYLPIFPAMRDLLKRIPRYTDRVIGADSCRGSLARACKALKLPPFTHHSFRHFFITNAIESGVSPRTLAQWVGHLDGGTLLLRVYAHVWPDREREAAERMQYAAPAWGSSMGHAAVASPSNPSQPVADQKARP